MVGGITNGILNTFYKFGQDNRLVTMSTDIASMSIRAPLTLLDKNARKEDRTHAALWQAVDYGSAIAIQLSIFPFLPKLGKFLAKNIFKYSNPKAISGTVKFTNFFLGYFLCTSVLMPFINSKYLARTINYISERLTGKKMMPHRELEEIEQHKKVEAKKKLIKAKIGEKIRGLIGNGITDAIKNTVNAVKKTIQFATMPVTYPVKAISKAMGSLAVSAIRLVSGDKFVDDKNENTAKKGFSSLFKKLLYLGIALIPMTMLGKRFGHHLGKKLEAFMLKENDVKASAMIVRALAGDALAKPLIILANGAPYLALRKLIDEGISISILCFSKPTIGKLTTALTKSLKLNNIQSEGMRTLLTTGIQTVFLLNVFLPMLNNQVTGRLFRKIFKDKFEKKEKELDKQADQIINKNTSQPENSSPFNELKKLQPEKAAVVRPESNFKVYVKSDNPFNNSDNVFAPFEKFMKSAQ